MPVLTDLVDTRWIRTETNPGLFAPTSSIDAEPEYEGTPKVLFVATSAGDGGIERHSVNLAAGLSEAGIDIAFACGPNSSVERHARAKGLRTETMMLRNSLDVTALRHLTAIIDDVRPDIVHAHSRRDFVVSSIAVHLTRHRVAAGFPRLIIHSHLDKPIGSPPRMARRLFAGTADSVVAVSEAVKRRLIESHGFAPSFIRVLHNGIEIDQFAPAGSRSASQRRAMIRKELEIPAEAVVVGMVGRLNAKGQSDLLMAIAPFMRQRRSIWLLLIGPEGSGGDMDRLREMAATEGISNRVIMTGGRDDVPDILPALDVLAHLPNTESFGLALVEAMASGLPTITADIGGCSEVITDEVTGILVPARNSEALQSALRRLLMNDDAPALRSTFGQAGRKSACTRFSLERQVHTLAQWYREIMVARTR